MCDLVVVSGEKLEKSINVRIYPVVEALVRLVADKVGYHEYAVRNTALIYGLIALGQGARIPDNDEEFLDLLKTADTIIRKLLKEGEKNG